MVQAWIYNQLLKVRQYRPGLAERLNLHRLELQEQCLAQGIPLRLGVGTMEEAQAERTASTHWNAVAESHNIAAP